MSSQEEAQQLAPPAETTTNNAVSAEVKAPQPQPAEPEKGKKRQKSFKQEQQPKGTSTSSPEAAPVKEKKHREKVVTPVIEDGESYTFTGKEIHFVQEIMKLLTKKPDAEFEELLKKENDEHTECRYIWFNSLIKHSALRNFQEGCDLLHVRQLIKSFSFIIQMDDNDRFLVEQNAMKKISHLIEREYIERNNKQVLFEEERRRVIPYLYNFPESIIQNSIILYGHLLNTNYDRTAIVEMNDKEKISKLLYNTFSLSVDTYKELKSYGIKMKADNSVKLRDLITKYTPLAKLLTAYPKENDKTQTVLQSIDGEVVLYNEAKKELVKVPQRTQILSTLEYYFGEDNLAKLGHTWELMNAPGANGFVSIANISKFHAVIRLNVSYEQIIDCLAGSTILEFNEQKTHVRRKDPFFHPNIFKLPLQDQLYPVVDYILSDNNIIHNQDLLDLILYSKGEPIPFESIFYNVRHFYHPALSSEVDLMPALTQVIAKSKKWSMDSEGIIRSKDYPLPKRRKLKFFGSNYISAASEKTFTVMTYNILAQYLTSHQETYASKHVTVHWNYRKNNILRDINYYRPGLLCMQEVQTVTDKNRNLIKGDPGNHYEQLEEGIKSMGYDCIYVPKTLYDGKLKSDADLIGNMACWRTSKFEKIKHKVVINTMQMVEILGPQYSKAFHASSFKDDFQIAIFVLLRHKVTGFQLILVTTHLPANDEAGKHTFKQMFHAFIIKNELKKFIKEENIESEDIPFIFCGDFNSTPNGAIYNFMEKNILDPSLMVSPTSGRAEVTPTSIASSAGSSGSPATAAAEQVLLPLETHIVNIIQLGIQEGLPKFESSYKFILDKEPEYTVFQPRFQGTLDYIWFTARKGITPFNILDVPLAKALKEQGNGIPNSRYSSDHVPLLTTFSIIQNITHMIREGHQHETTTTAPGSKQFKIPSLVITTQKN